MSASTTFSAPPIAPVASQSKRSEYSLTPVLAMPVAFLLVLLLVRLAAG